MSAEPQHANHRRGGLPGGLEAELRREQAYLTTLYARLDELRARTSRRLDEIRRSHGGSPQNLSERDAFATFNEDRLAVLRGVEDRLCFGRLDLTGDRHRYVGRIGLADEQGNQLLVDWRAPAAEPFYRATPATPGEVQRRRHLVTRGRSVVAVEDEVLDLALLEHVELSTLGGDSALMASLGAHRSGRMHDIAATIQAEQDEAIRADLGGVLVVSGPPGTGKTAVGLHRAAYLLYTHRERLSRHGVLLVGPNETFLRYIGSVLPSLGETGVVMSTVGQLFPGVTATAVEDERTAAVKGDGRMAGVIAAAVRARQRVPAEPVRMDVDGRQVTLRPDVVTAARARARRSRRPHNAARTRFLTELLNHLAGELALALGAEPGDEQVRTDLLADLRESPDVRRELNLLWMPLTPTQLLTDLYADPDRLAEAAPRLRAGERALLRRDRDGRPVRWTPADVPLLDEAAELLGEDETSHALATAQQAAERRRELEYARDVLSFAGVNDDQLVSAEQLADQFADAGPSFTVAERAAADRTWTYGHVVVDEAQELSPMAWRLLMRRCPSRSMTVVGDLAQTGSLAGARSWAEVFDPYVAGRWRNKELTVNYRTPRQVMDLAIEVFAAHGGADGSHGADGAGGHVPHVRSAREGDFEPLAVHVDDPAGVPARTADMVAGDLELLGPGRLAVITPRALRQAVTADLTARLPAGTVADSGAALDAPVTVLTVVEAKGLEVDTVVLLEPARMLTESARGVRDLYVALTRPTQRLRVVHSLPLPDGMGSLSEASALSQLHR